MQRAGDDHYRISVPDNDDYNNDDNDERPAEKKAAGGRTYRTVPSNVLDDDYPDDPTVQRRTPSGGNGNANNATRSTNSGRGMIAIIFGVLILITLLAYVVGPLAMSFWDLQMAKPAAPTHQSIPTRPELNRTKLALLVEQRPLNNFVPILLHYIATIPEDWPFHVMVTPANVHVLDQSSALQKYFKSGKLAKTIMPPDIILRNAPDVSAFLTKTWLWDQFPDAEHIFFFQLDAMICSNSPQSIDDYIQFDWVGAPWPHFPHLRGGNGGFSMRRKSRMLRCLRDRKWKPGDQPEDVWYTECLQSYPDANMPTLEQGRAWAVEGYDNTGYLGIHKPYNGVNVSSHFDFCPEAAMLFIP